MNRAELMKELDAIAGGWFGYSGSYTPQEVVKAALEFVRGCEAPAPTLAPAVTEERVREIVGEFDRGIREDMTLVFNAKDLGLDEIKARLSAIEQREKSATEREWSLTGRVAALEQRMPIYQPTASEVSEWGRAFEAAARRAPASPPVAREAETCRHCGSGLRMNGCNACGAPVCCPKCCQENSAIMRDMAEAERRARVAALEEAAKVCDHERADDHGRAAVADKDLRDYWTSRACAAGWIADKIRRLASSPPAAPEEKKNTNEAVPVVRAHPQESKGVSGNAEVARGSEPLNTRTADGAPLDSSAEQFAARERAKGIASLKAFCGIKADVGCNAPGTTAKVAPSASAQTVPEAPTWATRKYAGLFETAEHLEKWEVYRTPSYNGRSFLFDNPRQAQNVADLVNHYEVALASRIPPDGERCAELLRGLVLRVDRYFAHTPMVQGVNWPELNAARTFVSSRAKGGE